MPRAPDPCSTPRDPVLDRGCSRGRRAARSRLSQEDAMRTPALLEAHALTIETVEGRTLVRDLFLQLGRERVAVVGRNGVGKSTLLEVLAGRLAATRGRLVCRGRRLLVPQHLVSNV